MVSVGLCFLVGVMLWIGLAKIWRRLKISRRAAGAANPRADQPNAA